MNKQDYYDELEALADEFFIGTYFKAFAGARSECLYCGSCKGFGHDRDCASLRYTTLKQKLQDSELQAYLLMLDGNEAKE